MDAEETLDDTAHKRTDEEYMYMKALYHDLPMDYVTVTKLDGEASQTIVRKLIDKMAQDGYLEGVSRFHRVLNINSMVINASDFSNLPNGVSAIGYRDLMGENNGKHHKARRKLSSDENSCENTSCSIGEESGETGSSCSWVNNIDGS
ncbi:hypothetical protein IFM89_012107 [Coptis chinensis]|uniref:Uncharacterized protein n=1 Tax=Coptis chinensis TaxID=261450 RepID=A0A835I1M0_9MAGN|nr:hypothetical protein IFM89_012107 [Coptis chinensis]